MRRSTRAWLSLRFAAKGTRDNGLNMVRELSSFVAAGAFRRANFSSGQSAVWTRLETHSGKAKKTRGDPTAERCSQAIGFWSKCVGRAKSSPTAVFMNEGRYDAAC